MTAHLFWLFGLVVFLSLTGFLLVTKVSSKTAKPLSWLMTICLMVYVHRVTLLSSSILRMLSLVIVLLTSMKIVTTVKEKELGSPVPNFGRWLFFIFGWLGTRGSIFAEEKKVEPNLDTVGRIGNSLIYISAGLFILTVLYCNKSYVSYFLLKAGALIALSFIFHFGFVNILACLWQWSGVDCRPPFDTPFLSTSLTEFWGKRWNNIFSEMTSITIYKPNLPYMGSLGALMLSFFFSGIFHDIAISLPVGAGYGLPTIYFLLHGGLVGFEKWLSGLGLGVDSRPIIGFFWTASWLLLPLPILFHAPFIEKIVLPLVQLD